MPFSLDHWKDPRKAIANAYQHDNVSYITHGALLAVECIKRLDISPDKAQTMKMLDYGCGTGRVMRVLAGYFGKVHGYDPSPECIAEAKKECQVPQHNISYFDSLSDLDQYDAVVSVNVLEHLDETSQKIMLKNITDHAKAGSSILLWYSWRHNTGVISQFFGHGPWIVEDQEFINRNPANKILVRKFIWGARLKQTGLVLKQAEHSLQ